MSTDAAAPTAPTTPAEGFQHFYYPYQGPDGYLPGALAYIESAQADGAMIVVAAPEERQEVLRQALPQESVVFVDTSALGRNPGRLIASWREWIGQRCGDGQILRAVNDITWSGSTVDDVSELRYHEWLLNQAFAEAPAWSLMCPYDTTVLSAADARAMARCHPLMWNGESTDAGSDYIRGMYEFDQLSEPSSPVGELSYTVSDLGVVRDELGRFASTMNLDGDRTRDLKVAVSELMSNSIRYGGGRGTFRVWAQGESVVCEVRDAGVITDPMVGLRQPESDLAGGRGLWFAYQLCDLVQIRSDPENGTRVRLHMRVDAPEGGDEGGIAADVVVAAGDAAAAG